VQVEGNGEFLQDAPEVVVGGIVEVAALRVVIDESADETEFGDRADQLADLWVPVILSQPLTWSLVLGQGMGGFGVRLCGSQAVRHV
jgi:hypothetical protein